MNISDNSDPAVKECCKDSENLKPEDTGTADLVMFRCQVCKCRHFELTAKPEHFGLVGAGL